MDEKEYIVCKVKALFLFSSFKDLSSFLPKSLFAPENLILEEQVKRTREYHSEEEKKYGVLAILIEVFKLNTRRSKRN